jgi:PAS domain S-box-containing protein
MTRKKVKPVEENTEVITQLYDELSLESAISRTLLNHLYEGIYFVDINRQFRFWNKGAENITGYTSDEIKDRYCYDDILCHISEDNEPLCLENCPLTKAIEENTYLDARVYLRHKDGHRIPVWVHVSPIKNVSGKIIGAVEIFNDDSDYEQLKQANKKLEELNNIKSQFLGMAAHDLRNPLSVISSFSSFMLELQNENLNDAQVSMLKKIKTACETMLLLINDLLDISAIESGKISLEKKKTSIEEVLNMDNYSMKLIAGQKNIDIEVAIENNIPPVVLDKARIIQVIENLLSNAVKFSFPGSVITIQARQENKQVCISVKDQGQGIEEEDLPLLFKAFEKTSTKPTGKESSTGLGLVIVKKIIEMHNGTIDVMSKLSEGTEFIIKLPLESS